MAMTPNLQNNFIAGLKTESTGLNFPENACTETYNCVFTLIGDVLRREGINFELNNVLQSIPTADSAINTYRWRNAGGDGESEIVVLQVGGNLYFFQSSNSTIASPLSSTLISTVPLSVSNYVVAGSPALWYQTECQFATGNGYLFVYHPNCDTFYCTFTNGVVSSSAITVQIRDFAGIPDGLGVQGNPQNINTRPGTLSAEHNYNLLNQGWAGSSTQWTGIVTSIIPTTIASDGHSYFYTPANGFWSFTFSNLANSTNVVVGQSILLSGSIQFYFPAGNPTFSSSWLLSGKVSTYSGSGNNMTVDITGVVSGSSVPVNPSSALTSSFTIYPSNAGAGLITTWHSAFNNYPSNADIWFAYKNTSDVFDPTDTFPYVSQSSSPAAQGHFILNAFNQNQSGISGLSVSNISTSLRASTGTWFQGRAWFTGVNAAQATTGDQPYYTWTENIYFSQIATDPSLFGLCYQTNDPTDETLFELLPTDGGVITIQGSGNIYKLFPFQNGLLVFAANGIWFITGSQGIGFTANDYTITKIPNSPQCISSTSFVDVQGTPYFWNEEGIYVVKSSQQQGLMVEPITLGTILTFYNGIPLASKRYVRGDYNPITYIVQWVYRSTVESSVTTRYQYDTCLLYNTVNKAFYPYSISSNDNCYINGILYLSYPSGAVVAGTQPDPTFKYLTTVGTNFTFSEENDDTHYLDWYSYDNTGVNYTSYFTTGYRLEGKALRRFSPTYILMYSRVPTSYTIQGIWDYANTGNSAGTSGRYSSVQVVSNTESNLNMIFKRHKIRGHGMSLQLNVSSVQGQPFDIIGWSEWIDNDDGF